MGVFDELLRRGPTEDPFLGGTPAPPRPPDDEVSESFAAMNQEISDSVYPDQLGDPILPCRKPWLELTLLDADGNPASNQPFELSVPGADGIQGTLDDSGFVHIDDVEVDGEKAFLKVDVEENDLGEVIKYKLEVVPVDSTRPDDPADPEGKDGAPLLDIRFERDGPEAWTFAPPDDDDDDELTPED